MGEQAARVVWRDEHSCALHIWLKQRQLLLAFVGGSRVGKNTLTVSWLTWVSRVIGNFCDRRRELLE